MEFGLPWTRQEHRGTDGLRQRARGMVAAAGLFLAALAAGPAQAASGPGVVPRGVWLMENGKAAVEFYRCEPRTDRLCGRLLWGRPDQFPDGTTRDRRNPDPKLKDRELCGAPVVWDLRWKGGTGETGEWGGGHVYDPTSGETYGARMEIQAPDRLRVRGYILGIAWLGKSQTWRPAPPEIMAALCTAPLAERVTAG